MNLCKNVIEKIDFENWERKERFLSFKNNPCSYSIGLEFEYEFDKKPYICLIYAITKTINELKEFRVCYDELGDLSYFTKLHPFYTIFNKTSENFINVYTEFDENFNVFFKNCSNVIEKFKHSTNLNPQQNLPKNLLHISALPWFKAISFNLVLKNGFEYFLPIFTISQIKNNKFTLFIQANHCTIDGFHIYKFEQRFRDNLLNLSSNSDIM